ncbi:MAG: DUF1003 domain-containing protein [Pirellulales bacterium]|nr:DUF1003 domain-containing protein [Pirellulales bacterium]
MRKHAPHRLWPWREAGASKRTNASPLAKVLQQNIRTIDRYRADVEREKSLEDHVADGITRWSGSMLFVYLHVALFGVWIAWNVGWLGVRPFDPYPFGLLTTFVSLEAIFLSTFVLVSQNRQAELADRRSELDLQVNLLAEHEMTRVLSLLDTIAEKLGCPIDEDLGELKTDVKPEELLEELDRRAEQAKK